MIDSMTAFAHEQYAGAEGELIWELRSVNHRYLELSVRLPEELRNLEPLVREHISQRLQRGKVDCVLRYHPNPNQQVRVLVVNIPLLHALNSLAKEIASVTGGGATPTIMELMRWPGVLQERPTDLSAINARATALFDQALESLALTRRREGTQLEATIRQRCQALQQIVELIRPNIPALLADMRNRLMDKLQEAINHLDPTRVEQEMVLLAQRLDIEEELDRLLAHIHEVERVISCNSVVGRRLDFLMQELNREANTIASKVSDIQINHYAVDMKVIIEQMREQVQNLE